MEAIKEEDILQDSDSFYMRVPDARKLVAVLNELSSRIEAVEGKPSYVGRVDYVNFPANREDMIPREKEPSTDVGWEQKVRREIECAYSPSDLSNSIDTDRMIEIITHQKNLSFREGREAKFDVVLMNWQEMERDAKKQARKEVIERVRNWLSIRPDVLIDPSARESLSEMLNSLEGPKN